MSRKRRLKKQRKRRARWVGQLEDLYLRRDDEAFLEAARPHLRELDSVALTGAYREVSDRALAAALSGGDLERIGALLEQIQRDDAPSPPVLLAEAVVLLAEGRREQAAIRLAALDEGGEAVPGVARRLPEMLGTLARPAGAPAARAHDDDTVWREIASYTRLSHAIEAHALPDSEAKRPRALPRSLGAVDPRDRAVWDFYRALAAVTRRNFRPGAKTLAELARSSKALRAADPADASLERLLRETEKRLGVLTALHPLEQKLRRRRRDAGLEHFLLERLPTIRGPVGKLLQDPSPALLRPLQHALRTRWRAILELIFERRGDTGLAVLLAARPELLEADLDAGAGVAEARQWAEVRSLLESEDFDELASFLKSAAARAETPERLAQLWTLELWARREDLLHFGTGEEAHDALVRLLEMAASISKRFDTSDRPQVARALRAELIGLCQVLLFCGHFLDAAETLLEHLGDDSVLLAIAFAAAADSRADRSRHEHAVRIAARGPAPGDLEDLLEIIDNLSAVPPATVVPALEGLRPLFSDDDWPKVIDRVATEVATGIFGGLLRPLQAAFSDPEDEEWLLGEIRRDLNLCRPLLGEHPELAALEVVVESWSSELAEAGRHARRFLSRFSALEPALALYRHDVYLREEGIDLGFDEPIVDAVIDRLDVRLPLWFSHLSSLIEDVTPRQLRRLRKKLRAISQDENLDDDKREILEELGETLREFQNQRKRISASPRFDLPEGFEAGDARPARPGTRRRKPVDDRQLELFTPE